MPIARPLIDFGDTPPDPEKDAPGRPILVPRRRNAVCRSFRYRQDLRRSSARSALRMGLPCLWDHPGGAAQNPYHSRRMTMAIFRLFYRESKPGFNSQHGALASRARERCLMSPRRHTLAMSSDKDRQAIVEKHRPDSRINPLQWLTWAATSRSCGHLSFPPHWS